MRSAAELILAGVAEDKILRLRCLELAAEFRASNTAAPVVIALADEFYAYVNKPDTSAAEPGRSPESRAADAGDTARKGPAPRAGHPIRDQKP